MKRCPWCLSGAVRLATFLEIRCVVCEGCATEGPRCGTETEAIIRWNKRPEVEATALRCAEIAEAESVGQFKRVNPNGIQPPWDVARKIRREFEIEKGGHIPTRAELDAAMYPCLGCGALKSGADGGSIYWWCHRCWNKELSATGGAR